MVTIRVVEESDLAALIATFPESNSAPESRHAARAARAARQRGGEVTCLAAWELSLPVGYVFVRWPGRATDLTEHAVKLGCAELADLFVAEAVRGKGIGRALVEAAEVLATRAGQALLGLEVTVANPYNNAARVLYARMGYEDAGFGEFVSGYTYYDAAGLPRRDEELHRYLVKLALAADVTASSYFFEGL